MSCHQLSPAAAWAITATVCLTCIVPAAGCAGFSPQSKSTSTASADKAASKWKMPWSKKDDEPQPYPNPTKLAATWTPDTYMQAGSTPTRGFGGRLFFYDEKVRAVPVEGELTVHAFAENPDGSVGEVKRYHFTAEQFTQHFSQSDLGASYSVWIPWDAVGGDQMRISLVPSFRTVEGRVVQGESAMVGLPGRRYEVEATAKRPSPMETLLAQRDSNNKRMTTTTIPLGNRQIEAAPRSNRNQLTAEQARELIARARATTTNQPVAANQPNVGNNSNLNSSELPSFTQSAGQAQAETPLRFPSPPVNVMQTSGQHP